MQRIILKGKIEDYNSQLVFLNEIDFNNIDDLLITKLNYYISNNTNSKNIPKLLVEIKKFIKNNQYINKTNDNNIIFLNKLLENFNLLKIEITNLGLIKPHNITNNDEFVYKTTQYNYYSIIENIANSIAGFANNSFDIFNFNNTYNKNKLFLNYNFSNIFLSTNINNEIIYPNKPINNNGLWSLSEYSDDTLSDYKIANVLIRLLNNKLLLNIDTTNTTNIINFYNNTITYKYVCNIKIPISFISFPTKDDDLDNIYTFYNYIENLNTKMIQCINIKIKEINNIIDIYTELINKYNVLRTEYINQFNNYVQDEISIIINKKKDLDDIKKY